MSWQEDLQQLDKALAEGRVSADEYRRRRDELLSSASPTGIGSAPVQQPQSPGNPFAPPFRWETGTPPAQPDTTQVVNPEATQVVQTRQGADAERTQIVRPVGPPQGAPGPQQQPQGWQSSPPPSNTPPWGNDGFSPSTDMNPGWIAQGPEVFESDSGGGKKVFVILGVVLLLAGIGAGVYFMTRNTDGNAAQTTGQTTQQTQAAQTTTTTKPKPTDPNEILLEQIPELAGKEDAKSEVLTPDKILSLNEMAAGEVDILNTSAVTKVAWKSASKKADEFGPTADRFSVMVIPTASPADAAALLGKLKQFQEANGLVNIPEPLPNMPPAVVFDKQVLPDLALYRGLYVSGNNVVRVQASQKPMTGEAGLSGSYQRQVQLVLPVFPAK